MRNLLRERVRANLELEDLACGPFSAFDVEWSSCGECRPDAFAFPTRARIINPAVDSLRIETHRVWNAQTYEFAIHQSQKRFGFVAGCERYIFAQAEHIEVVYEVVVGGICACGIHGA